MFDKIPPGRDLIGCPRSSHHKSVLCFINLRITFHLSSLPQWTGGFTLKNIEQDRYHWIHLKPPNRPYLLFGQLIPSPGASKRPKGSIQLYCVGNTWRTSNVILPSRVTPQAGTSLVFGLGNKTFQSLWLPYSKVRHHISMSSCEPRGPFAVKRIWFRTSTRPQRTQESYSCCLFHNITLDKMTNHYPKLPSLIPSRFALSNVFWDLNTILPLFTRAINPDQHWH